MVITNWELIKKLMEYGPDQKVVFEIFKPRHPVTVESENGSEEILESDIDLSLKSVEDVYEQAEDGGNVNIYICLA